MNSTLNTDGLFLDVVNTKLLVFSIVVYAQVSWLNSDPYVDAPIIVQTLLAVIVTLMTYYAFHGVLLVVDSFMD